MLAVRYKASASLRRTGGLPTPLRSLQIGRASADRKAPNIWTEQVRGKKMFEQAGGHTKRVTCRRIGRDTRHQPDWT